MSTKAWSPWEAVSAGAEVAGQARRAKGLPEALGVGAWRTQARKEIALSGDNKCLRHKLMSLFLIFRRGLLGPWS